uniref:Transmembrane protein 87A n=1 Tax=Plectus sambesii TaxID=2011161 RepID=A0A914W482_9BILA
MLTAVLLFGCLSLLLPSSAWGSSLLTPGKVQDNVQLKKGDYMFVGFPLAFYSRTEVQILFHCTDNTAEYEFEAQFTIRSSPCYKEFFDVRRRDAIRNSLEFYFSQKAKIPGDYHYDKIVHYKSPIQKIKCKNGGTELFPGDMANMNVTKVRPEKRSYSRRIKRQPSVNGHDTIDDGISNQLSSWYPAVYLPIDGIYFLIVRLQYNQWTTLEHNVTVEVQWRGPKGYLTAIDYPLLTFYGVMCGVYGVYALAWLLISLMYWKNLRRIHYCIGAVILLGVLEKAVFYAEYQTMNITGRSVEGAIELAQLVSYLKRTLARMLIIAVSIGYGIVKPRLGLTLHKVVGVGFVYFILCAIVGVERVSKNHPEAVFPLLLLDVGIFCWIITALGNTMRTLRLQRDEVKLSLYRHFTNTFCIAVLASVAFIFWSLYEHVFTDCLKDWTELWIGTAFWQVLFSAILMVIMILWRPSNNNHCYAFTPLLNNSEQ